MEYCNRAKGVNIVKEQLLEESQFDSMIVQCILVSLRAWHNVEEEGKSSMSFAKIMQSPGKIFTDISHRLCSL